VRTEPNALTRTTAGCKKIGSSGSRPTLRRHSRTHKRPANQTLNHSHASTQDSPCCSENYRKKITRCHPAAHFCHRSTSAADSSESTFPGSCILGENHFQSKTAAAWHPSGSDCVVAVVTFLLLIRRTLLGGNSCGRSNYRCGPALISSVMCADSHGDS